MNRVASEPISPATRDGPAPRFSSRAVWVTLTVLLAGAAYLCFLVLRPFAVPLLAGAVMAVLFYPLHERIRRRVVRPSLAALLSTALVVVAFVAPLVFIVSAVIQELRQAFQAFDPEAVNAGAGRLWDALRGPLDTLAGWFGSNGEEVRANIAGRVQEIATAAVRRALSLVTVATSGVVSSFIAILALYFFLRHGGRFYQQIAEYSPLGQARTARLADAAQGMIVATFYGVLAVAAAQGLLTGIGAWIAGLPAPALWGLAAAAASVLPVFGSALVWLPGAAVLFYQGSIGSGIFLLIWGALLVANSDNVVRPLVLMARMPVNALVILITVLGGVQAFGLIGILFGPVILALTVALLRLLREEMESSNDAA